MPKKKKFDAAPVLAKLKADCKHRKMHQRQRLADVNRTIAQVANVNGYDADAMDEKKRKKMYKDAEKMCDAMFKDGSHADHPLFGMVCVKWEACKGLRRLERAFEKEISASVSQLPIADWIDAPEQAGIGPLGVGLILGVTGDLSNYSNPGKVWKMMASAPFERSGVMRMPSTWRSDKSAKVTADEWVQMSYAPNRRAMMRTLSDSLIKQNKIDGKPGPYRLRYDEAKASGMKKWPEGTNKQGVNGHAHAHGLLLCGKLLLKNLWIEWNPGLVTAQVF